MSIIQDLVNALNLNGLFQDEPDQDDMTEQWMDQQRSWHAADHAAWQRQARAEYQERQRQAAPVAEAYDTGGFWIAAGAVGAILLILLGLALVLS